MATWKQFAEAAPDMAEVGQRLLKQYGLAYLGTARRDGSPRVHPVCPVIAGGRVFVATAPSSPKRFDLLRDGRYVLHMLPGEQDAEFLLRGRAELVDDPETRAMVVEAAKRTVFPDGSTLQIKPEELVFEYHIEEVMTAYWENAGTPDIRALRRKWRASG